ncbi:MAG: ATP-binding cassette domain-containing protein [Candidatus Sulfotelmatobacter sp.]
MLEVDSLTKRFGKTAVVDGVSFSVEAGEVVGLVGPNGAGKSTSMKIICALLRPNSGSVTIDGISLSENARRDYLSRLGALIESPAFYPGLNGRDHLAYLTRVRGRCSDSLIADTLLRVGLDAASTKPVRKYSTGMKQRLGIAMAILHKPKLLILDEPTNGLDPAAIIAIRKLIGQLAEDGIAVLVSSHLLSEIERVCNRVVFIKAGRVVRTERVQRDGRGFVKMLVRSSNPEAAREVLTKEDFIFELEPSGEGLMCTVPIQSVSRIGMVLVHSGLDILELSPVRGNLEHAYVSEYGTGMEEGLK